MPRPQPLFFTAIVVALIVAPALALQAHAEWPGNPFTLITGDNASSTVVPLDGKLSGALQPGYAYSFHVHAEAVFHAYGKYEGASAGLELVGTHKVWAGISVEKPTPIFPPYLSGNLVIKVDGETMWKVEIEKTLPGQHNRWDADILVTYYCNGTLKLTLSGHGQSHTIVIREDGDSIPVYIFAGDAGDAPSYVSKPRYAKIESCSTRNPWGQPSSGINDEKDNKNGDDQKLLYAVAGLGALALLLALARGSGGGVVVVRGRGMLMLLGALLLLAFAAGAAAAWRLSSHPSQNTIVYAVAGLGLLLILLLLMGRSQSEVIVVEGR